MERVPANVVKFFSAVERDSALHSTAGQITHWLTGYSQTQLLMVMLLYRPVVLRGQIDRIRLVFDTTAKRTLEATVVCGLSIYRQFFLLILLDHSVPC